MKLKAKYSLKLFIAFCSPSGCRKRSIHLKTKNPFDSHKSYRTRKMTDDDETKTIFDFFIEYFSKCLNNHERTLMQKFLKNIIKSNQANGTYRYII